MYFEAWILRLGERNKNLKLEILNPKVDVWNETFKIGLIEWQGGNPKFKLGK